MRESVHMTTGALADRLGCDCDGDDAISIARVATLRAAGPGDIAFCASDGYLEAVVASQAGAVLLRAEDRAYCPGVALVCANPYLAYAYVADWLHPEPAAAAGIHATAVVSDDASVASSASVGPHVVIEAGAQVAGSARIDAGAFIGREASVGEGARLHPRAILAAQCALGARGILHSGAVVGSDGFGLARDGERWHKVPQLGRVVIGRDAAIGANATVDRGAMEDTVVEDGVRLDDHVHIAHNVRIGAHTVMAGAMVVAGSTTIGRGCQIGGNGAITGHISIADGVVLNGMTGVTKSITESGHYASPIPAHEVSEWRRNTARFLRLDNLYRRLQRLEKAVRGMGQPSTE
jgi:UDP-3-O-[3-hydroxymyristoyl] glucosamine N-acyltransferase